MKLKSLSLALMLLSLQAMAAVQESTQQGTRTSSSSQVSTTTQELQQQAGQWGLSEEDYRRYLVYRPYRTAACQQYLDVCGLIFRFL